MGDADATRVMAKEHDLEFVDLDTYGVDPGAGTMLPAALSREHHVVVLKRRFGTPVIATAEPENTSVQATLRQSIGRDFISVVASRDQIGDYLDQLFGSTDSTDQSRTELDGERNGNGAFGGLLADRSVMIPRSGRDRRQSEERQQSGDRRVAPDPLAPAGGIDAPAAPLRTDRADGDPAFDPPTGVSSFEPEPSEPAAFPDKLAELALAVPVDDEAGDGVEPAPAPAPTDDLAEVALTVAVDDQPEVTTDSAAIAADLVDEAVTTYQEQHGEEPRSDALETEDAAQTASFPPLAKALVDGGRVSLEDMRSVLEEHGRSGQSVARILTGQRLVDEADLMWGMAQEMGLEFVDLDTAGVDFNEMGTIPETTARHHNVIVIRNDEGTPVVAASNPTDVFAMDDLRTIIGRSFKVVVATRSQIGSYINRAFSGGAEAADMAVEASLGFDGSRHLRQRGRRHPGRHRRRAHRPLREPAHPPGPQRAGLGHPRRADRRRAPHPVPDRRGPPRRLHRTPGHLCRGDHPAQGHGRHERGRAPDPPGRPHLAQRREQGHRPADGHPARPSTARRW